MNGGHHKDDDDKEGQHKGFKSSSIMEPCVELKSRITLYLKNDYRILPGIMCSHV